MSFYPETGAKHIYTTANGLLSNQFNYQSGFKDDKGTIYLGSIDGFIAFNPYEFVENKQVSFIWHLYRIFSYFNKRSPIGVKASPLSKKYYLFNQILSIKYMS